jgi:CheY-like chemotaxis protein
MMQPSSLLVVDADTRSLETLTFGFEREGCKVSSTSDPRRASQLARTAAPELAVVTLRGDDRAGLELIEGLKSAATSEMPIVAIGASARKPEALTAGATDFLPLPIFLRDVISVGRLSSLESKNGRAQREGQGDKKPNVSPAPGEIQMRLSEFFGLFYLLRAMAAAERSGVLLLTRGNRRAELRIHQGAVVSANIGALQGLPALHHVLLWEEAALSLTRRPNPTRNQLHLSSQEVLDECERFLRDFAHAVRDLGAPRTLYVPAADPTSAMPGLQPSQVTPLLRLFDGHRVLSDVIEESPFRIFDTVRMIRRLRDGGALTARPDGLVRERGEERAGARSPRQNGTTQKSMLAEWAMVPDQRGVVGNRRSTTRRLKPVGGPAPNPGRMPMAAPIPLTTRKGSSASGEIPAIRRRPTAELAIAPTLQVRVDALGAPLASRDAEPSAVQKTPPPIRTRAGSGRFASLASGGTPARGERSASGRQARLEGEPSPRAERSGSGRHATMESGPAPKAGRSGSGRYTPLENKPASKAELAARPGRSTGGAPGSAPEDFDAIEADFFAREADLYKREAIETFDDLDPAGGRLPGQRPRKKPG